MNMLRIQIITLGHEIGYAVAVRTPDSSPRDWNMIGDDGIQSTNLYRIRRKDGSLGEFYGCELAVD